MRAGRLDRMITIERTGAAIDNGYTRKKGDWIAHAAVRAQVTGAPGTERVASGENAASAPTLFKIRWSTDVADVNPKDRIAYGGRVYDIRSVNEIGRREALEILATARTD